MYQKLGSNWGLRWVSLREPRTWRALQMWSWRRNFIVPVSALEIVTVGLMMQWPPGRSIWFREGSLIELHLPSWLGGSSTYRCVFAKTLAEDASSLQSSEHSGWLGDTVLLILGNSNTAKLPVASQCPQHFEESAMEARFSFISWSPRTSQSHMLSSLGPWLLDDCWTCGVVSCGVAMRCFCMATVPQVTYT